MTGKSHATIGVVTYASVWANALGALHAPVLGGTHSVLALPVALSLVLLGALLPDIDHPESSLANEEVIGIPVLKPLAWLIGRVFGHRGITHSLVALVAVIALGQAPMLPWAWANLGWLIGWGYASHLVADALTKQGIPLFWPLPASVGFPPLRGLRFRTGTWREGFVVAALTLACLANALGPHLPRLTGPAQ